MCHPVTSLDLDRGLYVNSVPQFFVTQKGLDPCMPTLGVSTGVNRKLFDVHSQAVLFM